jgi:hypothetical protein
MTIRGRSSRRSSTPEGAELDRLLAALRRTPRDSETRLRRPLLRELHERRRGGAILSRRLRAQQGKGGSPPTSRRDNRTGTTERFAAQAPRTLEYDADHNFKLNLGATTTRDSRSRSTTAAPQRPTSSSVDRAWSAEDEEASTFSSSLRQRRPPGASRHGSTRSDGQGLRLRAVVWKVRERGDCRDSTFAGARRSPRVGPLPAGASFETAHGIPRITARSWPDAARSRPPRSRSLWQMICFGGKRQAPCRRPEKAASSPFASSRDSSGSGARPRRSGARRFPRRARDELLAYSAGQRAYRRAGAGLPATFRHLGYRPAVVARRQPLSRSTWDGTSRAPTPTSARADARSSAGQR